MTKPTTTKLGAKIRSARKAKGLTQEELAAKVGVTKATINKYESGIVTNFSRPRIKALADALDISPLEFIDVESPPSVFSPKNWHKLADVFSYSPPVITVDLSQLNPDITDQEDTISGEKLTSDFTRIPQPDEIPAPANYPSATKPISIQSDEANELLRIFLKLSVKYRMLLLSYAFKLEEEAEQNGEIITKKLLD